MVPYDNFPPLITGGGKRNLSLLPEEEEEGVSCLNQVSGGGNRRFLFFSTCREIERLPLVFFLSITGRGERNLSLLQKEEDEGVLGFILLSDEITRGSFSFFLEKRRSRSDRVSSPVTTPSRLETRS